MDLDAMRREIDAVDDEILSLFIKRMEIVTEIAQYKQERGLPILSRGRERDILTRVSEQAGEALEGYARTLFSTLFDLSRSYQRGITGGGSALAQAIRRAAAETPAEFPQRGVVACQGCEGAYAQLAADRLFAHASILYFRNFEGVFQAVEKGLCQYGVLPIENSSHGTVNEVYDLMRHYHFHIVRSVRLHIRHTLLAAPGVKLAEVREIFSHEQAIGQCSEFLKSLKDVKVTVCENTATAAKMVSESPRRDVAAISSPNCAALYGLTVLSDEIRNSDNNYTRFICIAKDLAIYPGANKISLLFSVPHTPGALYAMLSKFAALGLNLTKLESRPIPGSNFEFLFYADLEASVWAKAVLDLLGELSAGPELFVFLGSYAEV